MGRRFLPSRFSLVGETEIQTKNSHTVRARAEDGAAPEARGATMPPAPGSPRYWLVHPRALLEARTVPVTPGSPHPTQCSVHLLAAHPAPIYTPTVWSAARRGLQSSRGLGSSTLLLKAWLSQNPSTSADRPGPQEWAGDPAWGNGSKTCWGSCEPIVLTPLRKSQGCSFSPWTLALMLAHVAQKCGAQNLHHHRVT